MNEARIENANVLVEGNLIKTFSTDPIEADGATVIDGGGRTLMPVLIDTHTHLSCNFHRNRDSTPCPRIVSRDDG